MAELALLQVLDGRLDNIEIRMSGIENALNRLLAVFGQPAIDSADFKEHGTKADNTSDSWFDVEGHDNAVHNAQPETSTSTLAHPAVAEAELDSNAPFTYRTLNKSKSEIRILSLKQTDDASAPIEAELFVQSLDEEQYASGSTWKPYSALSYTWGAAVFDGSIILNGKPFAITSSLEAALRAMRHRSRGGDPSLAQTTAWPHDGSSPTYWWIDQININQADVDERNEQVALMRRIYKRAASVQIWLGEETDDSGIAMDLAQEIGASPMRHPGEKELSYPAFDLDQVQCHWAALEKLFRRSWWERVWIRQEIALSNQIYIVCGSKVVAWDAVGPVLAAMRYVQSLSWQSDIAVTPDDKVVAPLFPVTHHPTSLIDLHKATSGGYQWVSLASLLHASRYCKATDPRDTVFSALGLCDLEVYPVIANYRQELQDVLMTATRAVIMHENGLDILGACQNVEKEGGLPSWVPDLSTPWRYMPFSTFKGGVLDGNHNSELGITDRAMPNVQMEGECLILRGGHIDSIAHICEDFIRRGDAPPEELEALYTRWQAFVRDSHASGILDEFDRSELLHEDSRFKHMHWVRFLSALSDEARDLEPGSNEESRRTRGKKPNQRSGDARGATTQEILQTADNEFAYTHSYHHLNLKLIRAYLLPAGTSDIYLHPNRRIHAALRRYAPGRRLAISKRGFVALVPADSAVGDSLAALQGANFMYVLRQYGGKKRHVLVGEAFMPTFTCGRAESLAKEEFRKSVDALIRLY